MATEVKQPKRRLLRGARELAGHVLGDEEEYRSIYSLVPELPVFVFGGLLCGYTDSLDEAMARKEAAGTAPRRKPRAQHNPTKPIA